MNLSLISSVLIGTALFLSVVAVPSVIIPAVITWISKRQAHYAQLLDRLHEFETRPGSYVVFEFAAAVLPTILVALVIPVPVFIIIAFGIGYILPSMFMHQRAVNRIRNMELQLPDAITALSSSVRAGLSLPQAIGDVSSRAEAPLGQELALMSRQYENGLTLDDVLSRAKTRLQSKHFNLVASALIVNRQRGGDVTDILDRIGSSLREIYRLEEKMRVETAGPRREGKIMVCAPFVIFAMFYYANPKLVHDSFTQPIGILISIVATALVVAAFFWIQRIVNEDV